MKPFEIKNRKFLGGIILLIIIFSMIGIFTFQTFRNSEAEAVELLENMDITLYKIDIQKDEFGSLELIGYIFLENISLTEKISKIKINSIQVEISNNSEIIFEGSISSVNELLDSGKSSINTTISINLDLSSKQTVFLEKIFDDNPTLFDLRGKVNYKILGFSNEFEFNNILKLDLIETSKFRFQINKINLPDLLGENSNVNTTIFNPFSEDVLLDGFVDIIFKDYYAGVILLDTISIAKRRETIILLPLNLTDMPEVAIPSIFDQINRSINVILQASLTISNHHTYVSVNLPIDLTGGEPPYTIKIQHFNQYELNRTLGKLFMDVNLEIGYYIPFDFNLSSIIVDIFTINRNYIAKSSWNASSPISLISNHTFILEHFIVNSTDLNTLTVLQIILGQKIIMKNGQLVIDFFGTSIFLPLEDEIIDINI